MKDIAGFENEYGITSCGKVWSYKTSKFLKTSYDKDGYERITLVNNNGIRNSYLIHRLVAQAYIPNKLNLSDANHIDRIKKHNYLQNLEWLSREDNQEYSNWSGAVNVPKMKETMTKKFGKAVYCQELESFFPSISEAARIVGVNKGSLSRHLNGQTKTCGGYHCNFIEN